MKRFAKRIIAECRCESEIFQEEQGVFVELQHFNNYFAKNTKKEDTAGKYFRVFSMRYS